MPDDKDKIRHAERRFIAEKFFDKFFGEIELHSRPLKQL
ncbi:hypothetical protein SAMN05446927_6552 [Caballeronia arationis]|uniref:Uncharacterized protein n=1 Tax=Caballeronia arationis TaxID=1777142 RepID=A0A7Z7IC24_9BURK|nr:hypothetical protein SAMN05446927_6552 [Caballeronia arationis]